MKIDSIEIRVCRNTQEAMADSEMRSGGKSTFDFLVITLRTDDGIEGTSFGFAGRGAEMAGQVGLSEQAIRYNLRKFEELKIVERLSDKIRDPKALYRFKNG